MYIIGLIGMMLGLIAYAVHTQVKSYQFDYISYGIWGISSAYLLFTIFTSTIDSIVFNRVNVIIVCMMVTWVVGFVLARTYTPKDVPLFLRALIITGFVWLNSPVWSHPSAYVTAAVVYITVLFIIGVQNNTLWYRRYAYAFSIVLAGYIAQKYSLTRWIHPHNAVQITYIFGVLTVALFIVRAFFHRYKTKLTRHELTKVEPLLHMLITLVILMWGRALIIIRFDDVQSPGSFFMRQFGGYNQVDSMVVRTIITDVLLRIYYAVFAVITLAIGIVKKERLFFYLSGLLVVLVLYKIWCLLAGLQNTAYEIVAAVLIGSFIAGCVYAYQKMRAM